MTLFEHESHRCDLSSYQLALLDQLQRNLSAQVLHPIHQSGSWVLRTSQYVGVLRLGSQIIQILPKMYRSAENTDRETLAREATANLLHMLTYAGLMQITESEVADLLHRESDWFEILTYLFAHRLQQEWYRDPARNYHTVEEELPLLKGKWRLHVQFRRPDRAHRFAVAYDEFSVDILLNRIFRFVVERLIRLSRSAVNLRVLRDLRGLLSDVTLLPIMTVADANQVQLNRLTARYEPLLNLARLFLDNRALQNTSGSASLFAFVFDMNAVFERFVTGFLRRHRALAIPAELQSQTLATQARGWQRHLARTADQRFFRLKPDLLFHQSTATTLIIDTKYKHLDPGNRRLGISEADFYQMFAYAQRYACPRVMLLYPQGVSLGEPVRRRFQLEGSENQCVFAATLNIRRDLGQRMGREALAAELSEILSQR